MDYVTLLVIQVLRKFGSKHIKNEISILKTTIVDGRTHGWTQEWSGEVKTKKKLNNLLKDDFVSLETSVKDVKQLLYKGKMRPTFLLCLTCT